ncbi:MAG: hypothetical protein KKE39_04500 [Bacteroidetes bacterium]|nr:hypothetical protein [Bacteroidota bacterium]MBU1372119.1 hypothetical protein [Bacteroidota bacterium]MBU1484040.1 hypothetical protein [Bacteroidota bacterium]MBU1761112.1 hypothetical protein [Bacteroidota bacterium]MBU2267194.1 hypothetical protein [Bacteroidota bacterium]
MGPIYKSLLLRYQNYLIEFYQLIEDKEIIRPKDLANAAMIRDFLENLPDLADKFEIEFTIKTTLDELESIWQAQFSEDGFSIRSYTLEGLDELNEWYFHYHDDSKEYEGNLFADGDWDLFLEEVAEIDQLGEKKVEAYIVFSV